MKDKIIELLNSKNYNETNLNKIFNILRYESLDSWTYHTNNPLLRKYIIRYLSKKSLSREYIVSRSVEDLKTLIDLKEFRAFPGVGDVTYSELLYLFRL